MLDSSQRSPLVLGLSDGQPTLLARRFAGRGAPVDDSISIVPDRPRFRRKRGKKPRTWGRVALLSSRLRLGWDRRVRKAVETERDRPRLPDRREGISSLQYHPRAWRRQPRCLAHLRGHPARLVLSRVARACIRPGNLLARGRSSGEVRRRSNRSPASEGLPTTSRSRTSRRPPGHGRPRTLRGYLRR